MSDTPQLVLRDPPDPRRAGARPATGARALPIYQTTSYVFQRHRARGEPVRAQASSGNIYTRIMNPTQDAVEQRVACLEGGVAALLCRSGQAAETLAILNIAEAGDHVVASPSLYGGTYNLLQHTLPKFGISVTFVEDPDNLEPWRRAVQPNTKLFFGETISNPSRTSSTSRASPAVAHEAGVPLIVDNTIATPYLIRPLEWGADIVRALGHQVPRRARTSIAGVIVDGGKFDFGTDPEKFPDFNTPDPTLPRAGLRPGPRRRRPSGRTSPSSSRPASSCCATSVPRCPRSTPSSSPRASRR